MFSGKEKTKAGTGEKILDDLSHLAGGAVSLASGIAKQIKDDIRARVDEVVLKMDFVPRSEFERLEGMVQKLRQEQEELKDRMNRHPDRSAKRVVEGSKKLKQK